MKTVASLLLLLLLLLCFASPARAEYRSGMRMRTAGVTLTAIGVSAMIPGIILMAVEGYHNNTCGRRIGDPCGDAKGLLMFPGGMMLGAGGTFAAAGIPLWVIGHKRVQSAGTLAFAPSVGRQGFDGVSASLKLTF